MTFHRSLLLPLFALTLAGCENSATAFIVDGNKDHAIMLVREQRWFWSDEINQAVIASRLPECQRRVAIWPGTPSGPTMDVYEAGYQLWALNQGRRWYLASIEKCLVQDWDDAPDTPPGALVGSFVMRDGTPVFEAAANAEQ